jgi:hypothetical protein
LFQCVYKRLVGFVPPNIKDRHTSRSVGGHGSASTRGDSEFEHEEVFWILGTGEINIYLVEVRQPKQKIETRINTTETLRRMLYAGPTISGGRLDRSLGRAKCDIPIGAPLDLLRRMAEVSRNTRQGSISKLRMGIIENCLDPNAMCGPVKGVS